MRFDPVPGFPTDQFPLPRQATTNSTPSFESVLSVDLMHTLARMIYAHEAGTPAVPISGPSLRAARKGEQRRGLDALDQPLNVRQGPLRGR